MCKAFYYKNFSFNSETGVLKLTYQTGGHTFTEQITFPGAPFQLTPTQKQTLEHIFLLTHIACGISYYKAFLPEEIQIESGKLTPGEATFFNTFYLNGLGEFAVRNNLDLRDKIHFPAENRTETAPFFPPLETQVLVPVGGGKDSCVTLELLRAENIPVTAFSVGNPRPIRECVAVSKCPHMVVTRTIDPLLIKLNQSGTVYNGHVPITGMIAFLLWISAVLNGFRFVAMSCESSANSGNMQMGDLIINHQYSKSFDFETAFYSLTQSVTPEFRYFSLLRPIKEIEIAKLFGQLCSAYFPVFTSCNKAFKLDATKRIDFWCGMCDKCRFVFLILAPFIDKETLIELVGRNPLIDPTQVEGYRELLGVSGHKPFECVGEVDECRWAFNQLAKRNDWKSDFVIALLKNSVSAPEKMPRANNKNHLIPRNFMHVLEQFEQ